MTKLTVLLFSLLVLSPMGWAMDEKDIPPPPMPDYMRKHQDQLPKDPAPLRQSPNVTVQREAASTPEDYATQGEESVREEFLQAAEEDLEVSEPKAVDEEVVEGSITEISEEEIAEVPAMVEEDPIEPEPIDPEVLAEVEENLEQAEQEAEAITEGARQPSAKTPFKAGMYKFTKECTMYEEASSMSAEAGSIPIDRKLWIDAHNDQWHKAYKKSGAVYIPAKCLQ
jgi:hypothetical protein